MNARVKVVSGTFNIVGQVDDDKIDQIAKLLGLSDADKALLKDGNGLLVVGPLVAGADDQT
ncbi:MAG: hypothetical protein P4L71_15215 [Acetobacteraceae bacterium]|nr:hypothetical protein [Acetobacteraceae bacterium]